MNLDSSPAETVRRATKVAARRIRRASTGLRRLVLGAQSSPRTGANRRQLTKEAGSLRRTGNVAEATELARQAVSLKDDDASALRELVRCLHRSAASAGDLDEPAMIIARQLADEPRAVDLRVAIDHAIAEVRLDGRRDRAAELVTEVARNEHHSAIREVRRFLTYLVDRGDWESALSEVQRLAATTNDPGYKVTLHQQLIRLQRFEDAAKVTMEIEREADVDDSIPALLAADAWAADGNVAAAMDTLTDLRPLFSKVESTRMINAWKQTGRYQEIMDHLDQTRSGLTPVERALERFDCQWALGNQPEAEEALNRVAAIAWEESSFVDRIEQCHGVERADALREAIVARARAQSDDDGLVLRAARSAAAMNKAELLLEIVDNAELEGLGPSLRYERARALYALRRFDEASTELATLDGTNHTWTASKLHARILLETGEFAEAQAYRERHQRPGDGHDEALYHALLAQRKWDAAFAMDPMQSDFRLLRAALPETAERRPSGKVGHRFVIADAGPGDEIQDASLYRELAALSDQLTVTCDPRLLPLLERSMPAIDFLPVARLSGLSSGGFAPPEPPRAPNTLAGLLTAEAGEIAQKADSVVLGRSIKTVRDLSSGPGPVGPFLRPDPELSEKARSMVESQPGPTIGLVWRSELHNLMRDIHYVDLDRLEPLFGLGAGIACLQHHLTDAEEAGLASMSGGNLLDTGSIDLRNDFEHVAALLANLDLVIGIGTTMTNLAAAVGTKTLMMQPTHFGTWLATEPDQQHFWYKSCEVVVADPPYDCDVLVRQTVARAAEVLGDV